MSLSQLHPAVRELLCMRAACLELGFDASDLHLGWIADRALLTVRSEGKELILDVPLARCDLSKADLLTAWPGAVAEWEASPSADRVALDAASWIHKHPVELVEALKRVRLYPPPAWN